MTIKRVPLLCLPVAILLGSLLSPSAFAFERVVATVGGIPITVFEHARKTQSLMPMRFHGEASPETVKKIQKQALDELIEQAYKVRYALDEEIAVENRAVDKAIEPLRKKYGSVGELEKASGDEGLSAYRATIYRQLLAEKAEEVAVDSKVDVTPEEVQAYYEKHKASYKRPRQFKASQIFIRVDPSSNEEELAVLRKKAEELATRAQDGDNFYNLAYYNSDDKSKYVGGDLGYFHEGQTVGPFNDAILKMKAGEISDPVRTRFGFHIIKLVEVNEPVQLTLEDVRAKIRQTLEERERKALYEAWMSDLKSRYSVTRNGG